MHPSNHGVPRKPCCNSIPAFSPRRNGKPTRQNKFVATWKANNADANVIVRDLASDRCHLDAGTSSPPSPNRPRTARQQELAAAADALIGRDPSVDRRHRARSADVQLRRTFDAQAAKPHRAAVTFLLPPTAGVCSPAKACIFAAQQPSTAGKPPLDNQTTTVRDFLGFSASRTSSSSTPKGLNMGSRKQTSCARQGCRNGWKSWLPGIGRTLVTGDLEHPAHCNTSSPRNRPPMVPASSSGAAWGSVQVFASTLPDARRFSSYDANDFIAGFPNHPHRGFETVTYMLDGLCCTGPSRQSRGDLLAGGAASG